MKRLIAALLVSLVLTTATTAVPTVTPDAEAAGVRANYVTAPRWWGWCPGWLNGVTSISVVDYDGNGGYWSSGGDRVTVQLDSGWNQLHVAVNCKRTTPIGVNVWVRNDRSGQTHYIGYPGGSWSN